FDYGEKVARIIGSGDDLITVRDGREVKKFQEEKGVAFTEPAYFDIFNFPLLQGDKATVLQHPGQALITERLARKYFGDVSAAMGKTILVNNKLNFAIVGI